MAYLTKAQLTDRFGTRMLIDLTDRERPSTGTIVDVVVDRAIEDTTAVINGYIERRYALPLTETPALLTDIAASIAVYKLHVSGMSEKVAADYKDAMRQLRDIGDSKLNLPLPDGSEAPTADGTGARMVDRERPFSEDKMKGFI